MFKFLSELFDCHVIYKVWCLVSGSWASGPLQHYVFHSPNIFTLSPPHNVANRLCPSLPISTCCHRVNTSGISPQKIPSMQQFLPESHLVSACNTPLDMLSMFCQFCFYSIFRQQQMFHHASHLVPACICSS